MKTFGFFNTNGSGSQARARVISFGWLAVSVIQACGCLAVEAQGTPDIIWQTNGHTAAAFSPDGMVVASWGGDNLIKFWRASDGLLLRTLTNEHGNVYFLAFSPTTNAIAAAGFPTTDCTTISIIDLPTGLTLRAMPGSQDDLPSDLKYSPDGLFIAVAFGASGEIWLFRVLDGATVFLPYIDDEYSFSFSPDGKVIAVGHHAATIRVWKLSDFSILRTMTGEVAGSLAFDPSGTLLAAGGGVAYDPHWTDFSIKLWRISDGSRIGDLVGHTAAVTSLSFSPNGQTLLSSGQDNTIRLWRIADGALLETYDRGAKGVTGASFSPDGRLFCYGLTGGTTAVARVPPWVNRIWRAGGQLIIEWGGAGGLYQLQQRTNLTTATWENVGCPTTSTNATSPLGNGSAFYRVLSLPNP